MECFFQFCVVFGLGGFDDAEFEGDAGCVELVQSCFDADGGDADLDDLLSVLCVELGAEHIDGADSGFELVEVLGVECIFGQACRTSSKNPIRAVPFGIRLSAYYGRKQTFPSDLGSLRELSHPVMTVRSPVVCISCDSKIITRTQVGHKDMQKHSFRCRTCGVVIT